MTDSDPVRETAQALRAVSDSLLSDIEELTRLETAKRGLKPGDPALVEISEQIERLAGRVLGLTVEERVLSEQADVEVTVDGPAAPVDTIEATEPRSPRVILEAWRDAERRASAAQAGSPEAAAIATEIERLRAEYRATRG